MKTSLRILALCLSFLATAAQAQWQSTTYTLKGGWNAIYLSGDATYSSLEELFPDSGVTANVLEIWRWNPNPTQVQFTESPLIPSAGTPAWSVWVRGGSANTLGSGKIFGTDKDKTAFTGQTAYLVKCAGTSANTYSVPIKQSPLPPRNSWVRNGANLLGFPTLKNGANFPTFSSYFATFPAAIAASTHVFRYVGGDLGAGNPLQIFSPTSDRVDRTQAYWFSAEVVGNFYAPLEVSLTTNNGLSFGRTGSVVTVRVRNRTAATMTLTVAPVSSESAPASHTDITGAVPLTRRTFNGTTRAWEETPIPASFTEPVGPQSTVELHFGIDRTAMTGPADAFYASLLRLTDSSLFEILLPATATKSSLAGLWVGDVSVTNVSSQVTNTAKATAAVTNEVVTSVSVSGSGGYGYASAPAVTIDPPPASVPAAATAAVTGNAVASITLSHRGAGYVTAPTITIAAPPAGVTATATATLIGGVVDSITITNAGSGYVGNPTVTFSAPPASGSAATATAIVAAGAVTGFTITNPGSGYAVASPKVTIAEPPPLTGTSTPSPMQLRTLLHVADNGTASLLSQVFIGQMAAGANDVGICTQEALLKQDAKAGAQRLVAAHLPLAQVISSGTGSVAIPGVLTRIVSIPYNDPTNPFVHQYHPDHDNKDARLQPVGNGVESYSVTRTCAFTFTAVPPPGSSATGWGSSVIGGTYRETITGLHKQTLQLDGTFELRRASELGTLYTN